MSKLTKEQILQNEIDALKLKLEEQALVQAQMVNALGGGLQDEITKINKKSKSSPTTIEVHEVPDHKNISLWTKAGKRIGPMHPENAKKTLQDFYNLGVILSVDEPTPAQIEAYKQTPQYAKEMKAEQKKRAIKEKTRKSGQLEKLTEQLVKMYGTKVENNILSPEEVGK